MIVTRSFQYYAIAIIGSLLMLLSSCKKENDDEISGVVLATTAVTDITQTTATSGGTITIEGSEIITTRGVCWSKSQNPTINDSKTEDGTGAGTYTSNITGLEPNTTYYVRAYASTSEDTKYGEQVSFETTEASETSIIYGDGVTDIDGNEYITVIIGGQEWMAENLRTTKYNDGTSIPTGYSNIAWTNLSTDAYAVYPHVILDDLNSEAEVLVAYGALYNWYAVNTGNLCPTGWNVPTDEAWTALTDYAGGETIAGGKLKSTRTTPDNHPRWESPNLNATDEYGFSAIPGGSRSNSVGSFSFVGYTGAWWSSTAGNATSSWYRGMRNEYEYVTPFSFGNSYGFSVRCVKNN